MLAKARRRDRPFGMSGSGFGAHGCRGAPVPSGARRASFRHRRFEAVAAVGALAADPRTLRVATRLAQYNAGPAIMPAPSRGQGSAIVVGPPGVPFGVAVDA